MHFGAHSLQRSLVAILVSEICEEGFTGWEGQSEHCDDVISRGRNCVDTAGAVACLDSYCIRRDNSCDQEKDCFVYIPC